jgi:hypothetical protein
VSARIGYVVSEFSLNERPTKTVSLRRLLAVSAVAVIRASRRRGSGGGGGWPGPRHRFGRAERNLRGHHHRGLLRRRTAPPHGRRARAEAVHGRPQRPARRRPAAAAVAVAACVVTVVELRACCWKTWHQRAAIKKLRIVMLGFSAGATEKGP